MPVSVARAGGHDRHAGRDGIDERLGRRGRRPVMGDLQKIDPGQPSSDEDRVDVLLDVTGQQEPTSPELPEEDDRDVVDRRPVIGRPLGHRAGVRPEDAEADLVDPEDVAGGEPPARDAALAEAVRPRRVARP